MLRWIIWVHGESARISAGRSRGSRGQKEEGAWRGTTSLHACDMARSPLALVDAGAPKPAGFPCPANEMKGKLDRAWTLTGVHVVGRSSPKRATFAGLVGSLTGAEPSKSWRQERGHSELTGGGIQVMSGQGVNQNPTRLRGRQELPRSDHIHGEQK